MDSILFSRLRTGKRCEAFEREPSPFLLYFVGFYDMVILALPINDMRFPPLCFGGTSLVPHSSMRKGGLPMVTYSDLIQSGILVVGVINLFLQALIMIKKK